MLGKRGIALAFCEKQKDNLIFFYRSKFVSFAILVSSKSVCCDTVRNRKNTFLIKQAEDFLVGSHSLSVGVCVCITQKLWKWHVSSRFPKYRICLMGRSSCCDTVVKEAAPPTQKKKRRQHHCTEGQRWRLICAISHFQFSTSTKETRHSLQARSPNNTHWFSQTWTLQHGPV